MSRYKFPNNIHTLNWLLTEQIYKIYKKKVLSEINLSLEKFR